MSTLPSGIAPKTPVAAAKAGFAEFLKRVYLFSALSDKELQFLAGVIKRKEVRTQGVLFRDGDPAVSLFIVEKGSLQVVKQNPNGGEPLVLTTLASGTLFGEIPFVAGGSRTANVMAMDHASVIEITYDDMERLTQLNPIFGVKLYKALAGYLANHLKRTTAEAAGIKPEVKVAQRRSGAGGTRTDLRIPRPLSAPTDAATRVAKPAAIEGAPNAKVNASGEIILEMDD